MTIEDKKRVLIKMYLTGKTLVKVGKKLDSEKMLLFITLLLLDERPRTIQDLAVIFTVNHSYMSAFISDLEKKGIVKKKMARDQRFRKIFITDKGKALRKTIQNEGHKISNAFLKNLTDEEILLMGKLIDKLNIDYDELLADLDYDSLKK